jgi:lipoprotein-anchoring transpeptidase ErfK/SrfK
MFSGDREHTPNTVNADNKISDEEIISCSTPELQFFGILIANLLKRGLTFVLLKWSKMKHRYFPKAILLFALFASCESHAPKAEASLGTVLKLNAASEPSSLLTEDKEPTLRYVFTTKPIEVRLSRSTKAKSLGMTLASARLPVYEEIQEEKSGCKEPWLRVQYRGWVCSDGLLPAPNGEETEEHYENRLPNQDAIVLQDTSRYTQPGSEANGSEAAGTKVQVRRILEFEGKAYAQLKSNYFVDADALKFKGRGDNPTLQGVWFNEKAQPPIVFFVAKNTPLFDSPGLTNPKLAVAHKKRYEHAMLLEENTIKGKRFLRVEEGWFLEKGVSIVSQEKRPDGISPETRWALIDLSSQTLSAYEGDQLVFATLVSTGKEGHKGAFRTVKGQFRIQSKLRATTMKGNPFGESYKVKDVPWAQFFHRGYALHGAYWHNKFGKVVSHGCVNLSPQDAKAMSDFLMPALPPGWLALYPPTSMETSMIVVQ